MSKAFTKESDDGPGDLDDLLGVPDLSLPPGVKNYVTPEGAARLQADLARLRDAPRGDARRKLAIEQRIVALTRRLESAEVIDPVTQPADRVLFGATVTVKNEAGRARRYRIVGIDEADARRGLVSWRSPLAQALLDRAVGDAATLTTPAGDEELEIVAIEYRADSG